jgi:CHRD domain
VFVCITLTDEDGKRGSLRASLSGFQEVPPISTTGTGDFSAELEGENSIAYQLRFSGLEAPPTVAHIHFGQPGVAGGVTAFLCGGGGKPACTPNQEITGTITAADIVGPADQGIAAGEFGEALRALLSGATYANVHSEKWPNGEIRGQIRSGRHGQDRFDKN